MKYDKLEKTLLIFAGVVGLLLGIMSLYYLNENMELKEENKELEKDYSEAMTKYETLKINYDDLRAEISCPFGGNE